MKKIIAIVFGLVLVALSSQRALAQVMSVGVIPRHYSLAFTPDLENKTFVGLESILVDVSTPTTTITLNSINIAIDSAVVRNAQFVQSATVMVNKDKGTVSIGVAKAIEFGEATIEIHYRGSIGNSCCGFYSVMDHGRTYALVVAAASVVYPVFEDMTLKATYDVSVTVKTSDTALSNGAIIRDVKDPQSGTHTITFATSPKMSAYLFTLVVGQFECAVGQSDGIPIRVCGAPEYRNRETSALDAAESVIHFYNQYFDPQYPYHKLDMVALPGIPGAMESTACILANQDSLIEPASGVSNEWLRNLYLGPVAHEIAHQWFGDLVTMRSQQEFWLNEGMATWMAYKATAALQPHLGISVEVAKRAQMGMMADSLPNVASVRSLDAPDEITYQKSAAVLNMVEHYVGKAAFRIAINAYVKRYSYSNVTSEDLWDTLATSSGKPVDKILASFITQPGIPVVSVQTRCSNGATVVHLTQKRFAFAALTSISATQEKWTIPVCLRSSGHEQCSLLGKLSDYLPLPGCGAVYANAEARGYYRVAYEPENVKSLSSIAETEMAPVERVNFLNDAWAEMQTKEIQVGDFMSVVSSFRSDTSAGVLEVLGKYLTDLDQQAIGEKDRGRYRQWVARMFTPSDLGPEWETPANDDDAERKTAILQIAGLLGKDTRLLRISESVMRRHSLEDVTASPFTYTAAKTVITNAGQAKKLHDDLLALVKNTPAGHNPSQYLELLATFRSHELIGDNLNLLMSRSLSVEESRDFRDALFQNPAASGTILSYFASHWSDVQRKDLVTAGLFRDLGQLCDTANLNTLDEAARAGDFEGQWKEAYQQARSSITVCVQQKQELGAGLGSWLKQLP